MTRRTLSVGAMLFALTATPLSAQSSSFLYSIVPGSLNSPRQHLVALDVGYGERVFSAVGAERFEQRVNAQLSLRSRVLLAVQGSVASQSSTSQGNTAVRAEMIGSVFGRSDARVLAFGVGAGREYSTQSVALGRVIAGVRGARWEAMSNLRLERVVGRAVPNAPSRDGIDVITTAGVVRKFANGVGAGFEAIGEDLEGLVDSEEAEGGAKVMLGPTLSIAPRNARWNLLLGAGPIWRVTSSTAATPPGLGGATGTPARDLPGGSGYVVRTSLAYRW